MLARIDKLLCVAVMLSGIQSARAQKAFSDSTFQLNPVTVTSNRLSDFSAGTKINTIDSSVMEAYGSKNLSDLLADESPVFIKSYGMGSLATTSLRGGSANHTAVLWNGFNINSPMNGQLDLSLVPVNVCDNIAVQYGGTSALWGSGAVGGTIHLSNNAKFNNGITTKASASAGSFSNYNQQVSVEVSKKRFISSVKLFNTSAKNDFKYNNVYTISDAKVTQANAQLKSYGFLSENYFLINANQKINFLAWCQHTDRNLPPTMLQLVNKSNQVDNAYRFTSEWKYSQRKSVTLVRAAYFNEKIIYSDDEFSFKETSHAQSIVAEAETKITLSKHQFINTGIHNTYANAITSGYPYTPDQNRTALFASYLYTSKNEKLKATFSCRQELMKGKLTPFTFSIGSDYVIAKWLTVKANAAKVYRVPTFNDLYWIPGGNPGLLPENGYSEDASLNLRVKNKTTSFFTTVTLFNRTMENWIIWLPGQWYWSPQNLMNVRSRGIESNSTISRNISKVKISLAALTNYVVSTNQKSKSTNDASENKQLIYVPMYTGMAKMNIEYKGFAFTYRHNYTGYRYTSTDNTQFLKPYDLGSVRLSYNVQLKKSITTIFCEANNIWGKQYQVLLNRAMPQQNFNAGISIQYNHPNK